MSCHRTLRSSYDKFISADCKPSEPKQHAAVAQLALWSTREDDELTSVGCRAAHELVENVGHHWRLRYLLGRPWRPELRVWVLLRMLVVLRSYVGWPLRQTLALTSIELTNLGKVFPRRTKLLEVFLRTVSKHPSRTRPFALDLVALVKLVRRDGPRDERRHTVVVDGAKRARVHLLKTECHRAFGHARLDLHIGVE